MNSILKRILITIVSIVALNNQTAVYTSTAFAEQTHKTEALSPKVGNKLQELQQAVQEKAFEAAVNQAHSMLTWKALKPYEIIQIYNFIAYANFQSGNIPDAMNAYEKLVAYRTDVPQALMESTLTTLSKLHVQQGNNNKALQHIKYLFNIIDSPGADLYQLRASAHYQARNFSNAAAYMVNAIDLIKAYGKQPKENWLTIWNSANFETGNYSAMLRSLKELIRYYPKDSYIVQLAAIYSQTGNTKKQLALMDALYIAGIKADAESAKNVAILNLQENIPSRAAYILEKELAKGELASNADNLTLMANAWFQARLDKKAVSTLKQAAQLSDDADSYLRLGITQFNLEQFNEAIQSLNLALDKGVKNINATRQTIGLAYLAQEKYSDAQREFKALDNATGRNYLNYIDSELERNALLEKAVDIKDVKENKLLKSLQTLNKE